MLRGSPDQREILLINHPNTAYQFPAGTLKKGEEPAAGALRETREETGLKDVQIFSNLQPLQIKYQGYGRIIKKARLFSRPNPYASNFGAIRKGLKVKILKEEGDFVQVKYRERDNTREDRPIMINLTGWIKKNRLSHHEHREFFVVTTTDSDIPQTWENFADHHQFRLEWHYLAEMPQLAGPQHQWFEQYKDCLKEIILN